MNSNRAIILLCGDLNDMLLMSDKLNLTCRLTGLAPELSYTTVYETLAV